MTDVNGAGAGAGRRRGRSWSSARRPRSSGGGRGRTRRCVFRVVGFTVPCAPCTLRGAHSTPTADTRVPAPARQRWCVALRCRAFTFQPQRGRGVGEHRARRGSRDPRRPERPAREEVLQRGRRSEQDVIQSSTAIVNVKVVRSHSLIPRGILELSPT